tara:strand:+ start:1352 stop:2074 length:723 start_codon:yes stop_codon:yes gene_type:complete
MLNETLLLLSVGIGFVASHLILSGSIRSIIITAVGSRGYFLIFSTISVLLLSFFIIAYSEFPRYAYLWEPRLIFLWTPLFFMSLSTVLLVGAFLHTSTKVETFIGNELENVERRPLFTGVYRITRHPVQWAIMLWAASHLVANGDLMSVIFFGSFFLLSSLGTILSDQKKSKRYPAAWRIISYHTSNLPFLAILKRRTQLKFRELWGALVIGLVILAAFLFGHVYLSGVSVSPIYFSISF